MKRLLFLIVIILVCSTCIYAQKEGLRSIRKADMKSHMAYLASDELEGRETGARGNELAAHYLRSNLLSRGIQPIPGTGDYYQMIPLVSSTLSKEGTRIELISGGGRTLASTDSLVFLMPPQSDLEVSGSLVFAGFGLFNPQTGYNDFEGMELNGKVVLIMTGSPEIKEEVQSIMGFSEQVENSKFAMLFRAGPAAVLYVYNQEAGFGDVYESGLAEIAPGRVGKSQVFLGGQSSFSLPFPIVFVSRNFANTLIASSGHTLEEQESKIRQTGTPASFSLDSVSVSVNAAVEKKELSSPNVVGMIEGSDPELKNECIVYTAHFDHEGFSADGQVMNGADDNASGSVGILEIAEAFASLKTKPSRSIVFAWVNAEEKGLLGSRYYTENPVYPMDKTVLNINLDMIGRSKLPTDTTSFYGFELDVTGPDEIMAYTHTDSTVLIQAMRDAAEKAGITVLEQGEHIPMGSSDHASFLAKNVTAVMFHSGIHSDLHKPTDDIEFIDFDKMTSVSKMAFLLGYEMANMP